MKLFESVFGVAEVRQVCQFVIGHWTAYDKPIVRNILMWKRKTYNVPSVDVVYLLRFQWSNLATSAFRNSLSGIFSGIYITGIFGYLFCVITVIT